KRMPESKACRMTRVNSLRPSLVWLLDWFTPWLPVPMPMSDTSMPVLPSDTVSVGLAGTGLSGRAEVGVAAAFEGFDSATAAPAAAVPARNPRRWIGGSMAVGLRNGECERIDPSRAGPARPRAGPLGARGRAPPVVATAGSPPDR